MNTIAQDQLAQRQLDRLAAQRHLYSRAKTILGWQIILSTGFVVGWSLLILRWPQAKPCGALWGLAMSLADPLLFTPWIKALRGKAAKIQELFDCHVLQLPWKDLKAGSRRAAEEIMESSRAFKCVDPDCSTLRDWYPPRVGTLPLHIARLVCQRANCWWDAKLRRRYAVALLVAVASLSVAVAVVQLLTDTSFTEFLLSGAAPLTPLIILGVRQYREQNESAARGDRLRSHCEALWESALAGRFSPDETTDRSRDLQDEIYDSRCRNPLVFDALYNLFRDPMEDQMNAAADDLVEEAQAALSADPQAHRQAERDQGNA